MTTLLRGGSILTEKDGLISGDLLIKDGVIAAMGEKLPYGGMYVAHRTLPLPSMVRVTSISTGKSCVVRVNDRGPFHRKRIIDLSPATARALGFHRRGVHQVTVETVSVGDGVNKRVRPEG